MKREETLQQLALRRMPDYRGQNEARPTPRSTKSDTGGEAEKMQRVLKYHNADRMKIGEMTFMVPSDPGYADWKPRSGREWSASELPIGYRTLKSVSGVLLDIKKSKDKLILSEKFPEFVMQMLIRASNDYKSLLVESVVVVREALVSYAKYLISSNMLEGDNLSKEEIALMMSDAGLASFVKSPDFLKFFDAWKSTGFTSELGETFKPSSAVTKLFAKQAIENSRLSSAIELIAALGTLNVFDESESNADLARELGLNSKATFKFTKVDAYLMMHDQQFRYFVDGSGGGRGSRVYYWDWVRNHAESQGGYRSQF